MNALRGHVFGKRTACAMCEMRSAMLSPDTQTPYIYVSMQGSVRPVLFRPRDSQPLNPGKSRAAGSAITSHRNHEAKALRTQLLEQTCHTATTA